MILRVPHGIWHLRVYLWNDYDTRLHPLQGGVLVLPRNMQALSLLNRRLHEPSSIIASRRQTSLV